MTPAVSSRAPTDDPALTTARSQVDRAARSARSSAAASSGTMPRGSGVPPPPVTSAASAMAVASRTWPGSSTPVVAGTTSSPVERMATVGRTRTRTSRIPAAASSPRSWARSGRPAGASRRARRHVLVGPHHPVAGCGRAHDLDRAGHHLLRVLDHHDGVGAGREGATGRDRHGSARPDHVARDLSHAHRTDDVQVAGEPVRHAVRVGRPDGEAVDGRPREARQGGRCDHVLRTGPGPARRPGRRPRPPYAARAGTRAVPPRPSGR